MGCVIGPQLERLFATTSTVQIVQSDSNITRECKDGMCDVNDSSAWRKAYSSSGCFGGDLCRFSIALSIDGFNPYSHNRVTYSI